MYEIRVMSQPGDSISTYLIIFLLTPAVHNCNFYYYYYCSLEYEIKDRKYIGVLFHLPVSLAT